MRPVLYFSNGFQRGFYLLNCREYQVDLKEAFIGKTAFAVPALIVAGGLLFTPLQRKCFFTCGVHWGEAFLLLPQMVAGIYLPNDRIYQMFIWQKRQFERRPLQLFPELVSGDLDLSKCRKHAKYLFEGAVHLREDLCFLPSNSFILLNRKEHRSGDNDGILYYLLK